MQIGGESRSVLTTPWKDAESVAAQGASSLESKSPRSPRQIPRERHARANAADERAAHIHFVDRAEHLAEVANAGEYDLRCAFESRGIAHQLVRSPDLIERVLNRTEIAGSVIEDRRSCRISRHKSPLVEGN